MAGWSLGSVCVTCLECFGTELSTMTEPRRRPFTSLAELKGTLAAFARLMDNGRSSGRFETFAAEVAPAWGGTVRRLRGDSS